VIYRIIAAALITAAHAALSQAPLAELQQGVRIRLRAPAAGLHGTTTAVVASLVRDTLYVSELADPPNLRGVERFAVPLRTIRHLDEFLGTESRVERGRSGVVWGVAVYAVLAMAYIVHENATCHGSGCFGDGYAWISLGGGVPVAAVVGGVIGYALPIERWQRVDLRQR
jgi:hypothetical protein